MVSAIYIIAAGLGGAFLLGLLPERWPRAGYAVMLAVLVFMAWVAGSWLWAFAVNGAAPIEIITAGTRPPFAINFHLGIVEASLALLTIVTGLFSTLYMRDTLLNKGRRAMAVLLIFIMALSAPRSNPRVVP
jgi:formate hydrogenlyase subunit 3/multisubunit Na+/H+ antiporter MnhD subunit